MSHSQHSCIGQEICEPTDLQPYAEKSLRSPSLHGIANPAWFGSTAVGCCPRLLPPAVVCDRLRNVPCELLSSLESLQQLFSPFLRWNSPIHPSITQDSTTFLWNRSEKPLILGHYSTPAPATKMAVAGAQRKQVLKVVMISLLLDLVRIP